MTRKWKAVLDTFREKVPHVVDQPERSMEEKIAELGRHIQAHAPRLKGKWGVEIDEDGFEIAVLRGDDGRALGFMGIKSARAAGFVR